MAKSLFDKQKNEIIKSFTNGVSIDQLAEKYNFTKITISRNLKKNLGEKIYKVLIKKNKSVKSNFKEKNIDSKKVTEEIKTASENQKFQENQNQTSNELNQEMSFIEIEPLDYEIDIQKQKDLSSVSILEISFPKIVYMVVNNKIELEIKTLKDFPEWDFLSPDDLNRKTLQIYFDIKIAKRDCGKEQRVIKVPNPEVFRIVAPLLVSRGISRIVSDDNLIAL